MSRRPIFLALLGATVAGLTGCESAVAGPGDCGTVAPPTEPNIVFVTSGKVQAGQLGGRAGADSYCQAVATDAGLPGKYTAYLSVLDGGNWNAVAHLIQTSGLDGGPRGWVRPDGEPVIDGLSDLLAPQFMHLPTMNERRGINARPNYVATGTYPDGEPMFTCDDWTNSQSTTLALGGLPEAGGRGWTSTVFPGCADPVSLYCFGVDRYAPIAVPMPPPNSRRLFLTYSAIRGNDLASGRCWTEAAEYGLSSPGNFIAYQLGANYPAELLNLDGGDWYRLDGIKILTANEVNRPDAGQMIFLAPPDLTIKGEHLAVSVWVGDYVTRPGGGQRVNCSDWSTQSGEGMVIDSTVEVPAFSYRDCSQAAHVICVEK